MTTQTQESSGAAVGRLMAWIAGHEKGVLALGVVVQLAVLGSMVGTRLMIYATGEVYYVRVQPVDPRDLMRGDYVILGYEFSRIPHDGRADWVGNVGDARGFRDRDVFVTLIPEGDRKHSRADRFSLSPPDGAFLRGRINDWGQITYGIESFFVQEGKGRVYEEAVRSGRLTAEISVKADGTAALRQLHVEAK
jgi:uncharacterized membrane-anchored protein